MAEKQMTVNQLSKLCERREQAEVDALKVQLEDLQETLTILECRIQDEMVYKF